MSNKDPDTNKGQISSTIRQMAEKLDDYDQAAELMKQLNLNESDQQLTTQASLAQMSHTDNELQKDSPGKGK